MGRFTDAEIGTERESVEADHPDPGLRPLPLHAKPDVPPDGDRLHRVCDPAGQSLDSAPRSPLRLGASAVRDQAGRGLPGAQVRRGVSGVQGAGAPMAVAARRANTSRHCAGDPPCPAARASASMKPITEALPGPGVATNGSITVDRRTTSP